MDNSCSTVLHLNGILFKVCRWILLIPLCDTLWQSLTLARPAKTSACWRERVRTAARLTPLREPQLLACTCSEILYEVSHAIYIYTYIYTHLMFNLPIVYVVYRRSSLQHSGVPSCPWFPGVEENGPFWNRNDFTVLRLAMVLAHTQTGIFESIKSFTFDTLFHVFVLFNRPSFHMISSNFIKHMQLSVINCHKLPFWILLLSSEKRALPTTAWHPGVR